MFHHMKWDDQLLFMCSTLRSHMQRVSAYRWQTSAIQYDCRSLGSNIICTIPNGGHYLQLPSFVSAKLPSFVSARPTDVFSILQTSLLQVRKGRQVINCNVPFIHHLHHFFICGSHIPSHHINRSNIIDLIQNIIIMYYIDLTP